MSCLEMTAVGPELQAPDPTKHVLYNLGMVLGVDDFTQEFAYHSERDQWLGRDALGYGTLDGLRVSWGSDAKGPFVKVCPGTALTPRGQLVRVKPAQCAYLNPWLSANAQTMLDLGLTPPAAVLQLWVVLCYRDCPTDTIQIPGEPCQKETDTRVPSRLQDDFKLEIRTSPPDQREEDAIRRFVRWLRQIHPTADPTGTVTKEQFADLVRQEGPLLLSPLDAGTGMSPAGSPADGIAIPADEVCDYLQIAFRIWVTELRPKYHREPAPGGTGCEPAPSSDDKFEGCLLLAKLTVAIENVGSFWEVTPNTDIEIDETRRPILASMRMLQEWLLCGSCCGESAQSLAGDVTGPVENSFVEKLQGVDLQAGGAAEGQVLGMAAGVWQPVTLPDTVLAGDVMTNPDSVHTQLVNIQGQPLSAASPGPDNVLTFSAGSWQPKPPKDAPLLSEDVVSQADGKSRIQKLQGATVNTAGAANGNLLTFQAGGWVAQAPTPPVSAPLTGDVTNRADGSTVIVQLQAHDVKADNPAEGAALIFERNTWQPVTVGRLIAGGAFFIQAWDNLTAPPPPSQVEDVFGGFEIIGFRREGVDIYLLVRFDTFKAKRPYVVSGTHWGPAGLPPAILELVTPFQGQDALPAILKQMVGPDGKSKPGSVANGLVLRLSNLRDNFDRNLLGFTVQVTEWS